MGLLKY